MGAEVPALIGAGLLGLCFGSFLNVCIVRLPHEEPKARSLVSPPSTCPKCGKLIAWHDNIPVFSWLFLKGKCRHCRNPISVQYPIIEAAVALIWIAAVLWYGATLDAVTAGVLGTVLLGIAVIDARHQVIPDELNFGGLALGLALSLRGGAAGFLHSVLGAAVGLSVLWAVRIAGAWVFKEEAMGMGDVYMMAMVGSFVGWKNVLLTVFAGALFGTAIYLPLLLSRRRRIVPFGVYLAMGAAVTFVAGDAIIQWYLQFLRGS